MFNGRSVFHVQVHNNTDVAKSVLVNVTVNDLPSHLSKDELEISSTNHGELQPQGTICLNLLKPLLSNRHSELTMHNGKKRPDLQNAYVTVTLSYNTRQKQHQYFDPNYFESTYFLSLPETVEFTIEH